MPSILIVDDDMQIRHILKQVFEADGWTVYQAAEASSALTVLLSKTRIHAAIVDVRMPGATGVTLLKAVQKAGVDDKIVMVMMSGDASQSEENEIAGLGIVAYVRKPFHPRDMLDLVNHHITRAPEDSAVPQSKTRRHTTKLEEKTR